MGKKATKAADNMYYLALVSYTHLFHTSIIHVELTRNQSIHKKPPFCWMLDLSLIHI